MAKRINTVTLVRDIKEDEKMAPQMKGIVESIREAHGIDKELTVDEVVAAMEGNITTRQPLARIFGYYAPKLEELELIKVTRSEAAPKKAKKDKGEEAGETADLSDELDDESEEAEGE